MRLLRRIYTIYAFLAFCFSFLLLFPLLLVCIWIPGFEKYGRKINRFWAKFYFILIFKPIHIKGSQLVEKGNSYIFVANHFSYIDIAMMGFMPGDVVFVGKASLGKIPLFGYYFKKLHIAVNRESPRSRGEVLLRAKHAIDKGSSIVIFPEGGITSSNPPFLNRFKDGAFSLAIDKQIPVIPVTLSYNHLILPDEKNLLLNFQSGKIVFHQPILTDGLAAKDILDVKEQAYQTIQNQLFKDNEIEA
ncbi:lysophospholipid acyltransferase family protein [Belliella aquatica]|uniref:1-acyl-sn-glycerol-3-phosphate acyltransferase n=1 Tax=Belliella aquatica TaxID=1323734 RepID=A0ABQ1MDG0_9BACT|nr:lysophospholipid acyltransferase family protein [Belliella aquatica]MCH7406267.1 1-acyl-sn-glycerol-3-phosphate acyltransferase [Belliella aquatica]GGC37462.1 1-acyl-sn-glycerol-3-phosphate acyltransferase [Belliella aquatica]